MKDVVSKSSPSEAIINILDKPCQLSSGVKRIKRFNWSISICTDESAEDAKRLKTSPVSTSVISGIISKKEFSKIDVSPMEEIIGLSFIGSTRRLNEVESERKPSDTITIISACPCQLVSSSVDTEKLSELVTRLTADVSEKALSISV